MKKFISTFFLAIIFAIGYSQSGLDCNNSISIVSSSSCTFQSFTTSGPEIWLQFIPATNFVNISLETEFFGENLPHIHYMALIGGTCSSPIIIADDELAFVDSARILQIDLNANVVAGNTYYIKILREGPSQMCNKTGCTGGGPATFEICVQNINVIIPLDLGLEPPNNAYGYLTNRGQLLKTDGTAAPEVKLYTTNTNPALYFTDNSVSYVFSKVDTIISTLDTLCRVDMTFVGGNTGTKIFKTEQAPGITNYFLAHTPHGIVNNKGYYRTVTTDVYPNIDMEWYSNMVGEKVYFIVKPGGDPDDIILQFEGATSVIAMPDGSLKVITPLGNIEYEPPHAYRINPGNNIVPMPWQAKFVQVTANSVKFETHPYDPIMSLFIQVDKGHQTTLTLPIGICWSTYLGGTGQDWVYDAYVDANSFLYAAGIANAQFLPVTPGVLQGNFSGTVDGVIAKFRPTHDREFVTHFGGSSYTRIHGVTVDPSGNIYVVGNSDSPGLTSALNSIIGLEDAFIAKINSTGINVIWTRYIGGNYYDDFTDVDINPSNSSEVVAVGGTLSNDFPIIASSSGSYSQSSNATNIPDTDDAILVKFNSSGTPIRSTCFGGNSASDRDVFRSVEFDAAGNIFVCGDTESIDFPQPSTQPVGAFVDATTDGLDVLIAKFSNNTNLLWSTSYGGNGYFDDEGYSLALGAGSELFITGVTKSTDFNILPNGTAYYDSTFGGGNYFDAFFLKFNSSLGLDWATYYGGSLEEYASDIIVKDGWIYAIGYTMSLNLDMPASNPPGTYTSGYDVVLDPFVIGFNPSQQFIWGTYIPGNWDDYGQRLVADGTNLYMLTSLGCKANFPLNPGDGTPYFQDTNATTSFGGTDIGITCFDLFNITGGVVGLEESSSQINRFNLYPNPAQTTFWMQAEKPIESWEIFDLSGRKMLYSFVNCGELTSVDVSLLPSGIYFLRAVFASQVIISKLIVTK